MFPKTQRPHKNIISCLLIVFLIISPWSGYAQFPLFDSQSSPALSGVYQPYMMVGFQVFKDNPLRMQFLMKQGEDLLKESEKLILYEKLIKYFLTSLTIANQDMWVNLSPFESERILSDSFAKTQMSGDFLQQDYLLKTITSALLNPQFPEGKKFWAEVYQKVEERYGSVDVPVDVFNKVWIVPDRAFVYQEEGKVLITESHLKVMLESDYLAMKSEKHPEPYSFEKNNDETIDFVKTSMREVILPVLEREVNQGAHFVLLRQMYHAMLLATYFKKHFQDYPLTSLYVDQAKTKNIEEKDPMLQKEVYQQYLESYQQGVFDIIDQDVHSDNIPRKYMAGGLQTFDASMLSASLQIDPTALSSGIDIVNVNFDGNSDFDDLVDFYIDQLQESKLLVKSNGIYRIEPVLQKDAIGQWTIQMNVLFKEHYEAEHRFHSVMSFIPEGKNIGDVFIFVEDARSSEGGILPQGEGIATWLYQELVQAMPVGGIVSQYVINIETREFLTQRCFLNRNDVFFRDDQGEVKKIVSQAKETNEISLEDVLKRTLMGHLLSKVGLQQLRIYFGGNSFKKESPLYDLQALIEMLQRAQEDRENSLNLESVLVPSFNMQAQKIDAAEKLSVEEQVWQKIEYYIEGLKQAPPLYVSGVPYFLSAQRQYSDLLEDSREVVVSFGFYDHQGKEINSGTVMSFTVGKEGIWNLDVNIKNSWLPEGQGFAKHFQKALTQLMPDQEPMNMHIVNRETLQFLAQRCFIDENNNLMFSNNEGIAQKIVANHEEGETTIGLEEVLKQTKMGGIVLKQEGIEFKEIYVHSHDFKTVPTIFTNLEALRYLIAEAHKPDPLAVTIHRLFPEKSFFSFIKKLFPLRVATHTYSFHLTAIKNLKMNYDVSVQDQSRNLEKGGIDFAFDAEQIQTTAQNSLSKAFLWAEMSDIPHFDGLSIDFISIKPAFVNEVFSQQ